MIVEYKGVKITRKFRKPRLSPLKEIREEFFKVERTKFMKALTTRENNTKTDKIKKFLLIHKHEISKKYVNVFNYYRRK